MTFNQIIVSALSQLGFGSDQQTVERYRNRFALFVNDAICDLAASLPLKKTEDYRITGSTVDTATFERPCLRLLEITQDGFPIHYTYCEASGIASVRAAGNVSVTYRYVPKEVSVSNDVPEIPEFLHGLIVSYVVARERISGSTATQKGGEIFLQLYETGKLRMKNAMSSSPALENKF